MQSTPEIKQHLNLALKDQLTAINQYFLHARMAKNWGLSQLNDYEYKFSIKAMKQADKLIERILFLEGLPNLQSLGTLSIGETVPELLQNDLGLNQALRQNLLAAVELCERQQDYVSRDLLTELVEETEAQMDWQETQRWLIGNAGLENYLQSMMGGAD